MKYRKKPVVIEAFRFMIDKTMPDWFNEKRMTNDIITYEDGTCEIKTLEGTMKADFGDYIIQGVNGEVYPCKPDIFEKTYDNDTEERTYTFTEAELIDVFRDISFIKDCWYFAKNGHINYEPVYRRACSAMDKLRAEEITDNWLKKVE